MAKWELANTIYHRCGARRGLAARVAHSLAARREQILVHSYIQIHAQFFVQILVKLIAQILCTFSLSTNAHAALIRQI